MVYNIVVLFTIVLVSISAIGELLFPAQMLNFVGITSNPQTNFLLQATAAALLAFLPGLWSALRNPNSPSSKSALIGIAVYLFLSSAVDYYAHTQSIVNSMSMPSAIFRVLLGIVFVWFVLKK